MGTVLDRRAALALLLGGALAGVAARSAAAGDGSGDGLRLENARGRRTTLPALTGGRPAILHVWATWCAPCLTELPELARYLAAHPAEAEAVVIVSADTRPTADVAAFLSERLALDLATWRSTGPTPGDVYGLTGLPATLFLAADGTVAARHAGSLDWTAPETTAPIAAHLAR